MISCELTVNFESEENHRICYDSETVWKGEPVMAKEKLVLKGRDRLRVQIICSIHINVYQWSWLNQSSKSRRHC